MTEVAEKVLSMLRASGIKSFPLDDLTNGVYARLPEKVVRSVIDELERNGYIETHSEYLYEMVHML